MAMVFNISASLLGSVNVITTIINLRAKGMGWDPELGEDD
jgi:cytochrome c oxidase subunit 1